MDNFIRNYLLGAIFVSIASLPVTETREDMRTTIVVASIWPISVVAVLAVAAVK